MPLVFGDQIGHLWPIESGLFKYHLIEGSSDVRCFPAPQITACLPHQPLGAD